MEVDERRKRLKELTDLLNKASKVYYQGQDEIMSNYEYDKLYDELVMLERDTGVTLANSPTVRVGYEVLSRLPKEEHPSPMLSLDKTKDVEILKAWLGDEKGILSWKMDGLTIVLTYENGELKKAVTRGNGIVGEVITNNAKVFSNIPLKIPFNGSLVLRGEAVITYSDFDKINDTLPFEERYKNPRNLCSGSVRQLNNRITAQRNVKFYAFSLVSADGEDFENSQENKLLFLKEQGFDIVEYKIVDGKSLPDDVREFAGKIEDNDFPSDGLVLLMDDIAYGESLGNTAKFPRNAMAFKWADEMAVTKLLYVEWSASRTGLINPVAVFEPVELEGTTVSRASVHNVSILEELKLGIGDEISVYKANMIIPQIAENHTKSSNLTLPEVCPVCGEKTVIREENSVKVLFCENKNCLAKKIKSFTHFVSRDAMNIEGLSEATIEKFINKGFIHELSDIFDLHKYKDEIVKMEGFGEKSYSNIISQTEKAKSVETASFLYSLGISGVGISNAGLICKAFDYDFESISKAKYEDFLKIEGLGPVISKALSDYFNDSDEMDKLSHLLEKVDIKRPDPSSHNMNMQGMTFVITGSLNIAKNRNELKSYIENHGGKVTGSVSSNTDYLINNDINSNSTKNKKARELNIPIMTEKDFFETYGEDSSVPVKNN